MSEEYDLKKSENKIGQLYPILVSKDGKTIDGFHRKAANVNWRELVVPEIDTEEKLLIARLVANWHRRPIDHEEKEKWVNDLARLYKKEGLTVGKHDDGKRNEIKQRIMEVTGLAERTVYDYLSNEFKQELVGGSHEMRASPFERAEKTLGEDGLKQLTKQILKEDKLTPQQKAALTRKRQQEREEKQRKAEIKKREKEEKKKLDVEKRRKEGEEREAENQRRQAEQERIAQEKKVTEEEKRKQHEKKLREDAEKAARQNLLKDTDFQNKVIEEIQKKGRQSVAKSKDKSCSTGSCAVSQIIGQNEPETDVRSEQIAEFWNLHSHCLCKTCGHFTSCTVIR